MTCFLLSRQTLDYPPHGALPQSRELVCASGCTTDIQENIPVAQEAPVLEELDIMFDL